MSREKKFSEEHTLFEGRLIGCRDREIKEESTEHFLYAKGFLTQCPFIGRGK